MGFEYPTSSNPQPLLEFSTMRMSLLTIACVSTALACPAVFAADVDPEAKKILDEAAQAMRGYEGVSFKAKRSATGMLAPIVDSETTVKIWRAKGAKAATVMVDGRTKRPGESDKKQTFVFDGQKASWLDWDANKLFERPVGDIGFNSELTIARQTFLEEWDMENPFEREMTLGVLKKTGSDSVNGEVCDIVEATTAANDRNFTWAISAKDRLPRRFSRGTGKAKIFDETLNITDVKTDVKFTAKDFEIALPTGFVKDSQLTPPPAFGTPMPAQPAVPTAPVKAPEMGLPKGSAAPGFNAKDTTGKEHSLASMKGGVVVLQFWGPMFKPSVASLPKAAAVAEQAKGQKVTFVGIACREMTEGTAAKVWTEQKMSYPLIAAGDQIATDYKVAGFPSFVVIGADGNIAAFFQDFPGEGPLMEAIAAAGK